MATALEHYREAERLIGMSWEDSRDQAGAAALIARAQVHATLAAAGAAALGTNGMTYDDTAAWQATAGFVRKREPELPPPDSCCVAGPMCGDCAGFAASGAVG